MRIMHHDLHLCPYKIQILQLQADTNKAERRAYEQIISHRIEDHPDFLDFIFFSEWQLSSWFSHDKQNIRFWVQARHEHHYRPLSVKRVTVWCALGGNDIIGLNWF